MFCERCNKQYSSRFNLNRHNKTFHQGPVETPPMPTRTVVKPIVTSGLMIFMLKKSILIKNKRNEILISKV